MFIPQVAILMGTFNGAAYLEEQLVSIAAQTHGAWTLWVSDDGSSDDTCAILEKYRHRWGPGRLHRLSGPRQGFCANFLSLAASSAIKADYYAWADQDDIWLPEKLTRALALSAEHANSENRPVLYGGRTILTDEKNRAYGLSPLLNKRPTDFSNALLQSVAGGNTMVFNQPARRLISLGYGLTLVSHDWWAYMMISGCGGRVIYDPEPMMRYRQHAGNQIGSNLSLTAKVSRLRAFANGRYRRWNETNLAALEQVRGHLTPANQAQLDFFINLRRASRADRRLKMFLKSGLYRQNWADNLALLAAAALRLL